MAIISKRQIELEVRANNLSSKPLAEVVRNVNDLSEALEVQARLAEQGQGSVDDLVKTYDKLSKAGSALIAQTGVVERVDLLRQSVSKAEERVQATTKALADYRAGLEGVSNVTAKQAAELSKLEKAADRSTKALDTQSEKLKRAMDDAERIGLTTENWADAQNALVNSSKRLSSVQSQVNNNNLEKYADTIARVVKEQQDLEESNRSLAKAREATVAAEAKFNKERAESITKFKEADYAKLFDQLEERERQARKAVESANKAQQDLFASEQSVAAARAAREASQGQFEKTRAENLRKFKEADYARLFDELAVAEERAARESADLERELKKLGTTSERATDSQKKLARANLDSAKAAEAADQSTGGLLGSMNQLQKTLIGGERTSLGFFQRLRGEILSLIAAYAGFQGAVDLAAGALDAFRERQATNNKLLAVTNLNQGAATAEYEYIADQAERLGIRLKDLASGYASFRIAAKSANVDARDTKFIFESIAEAGSKLQLTPDNMQGIFKALEQLVSKGRASSEELKEQLGDRLPGVISIAAKAFSKATGEQAVSVEEFLKRLEKGEVNSVKAALALARGMNEAFGEISIDKSLTAVEGRFQTALDNWKRTLAESGLVEAYSSLLKNITEFLKSEGGVEVAKGIGEVFASIADVLNVLVKNIETVKVVLKELFVIFSAFVAIRFTGWVIGVTQSLSTLAATITGGLIPAITAMGAILGAIVLIPIAVWAYSEFEGFRKAVDGVVLGLRALWEGVKIVLVTVREGFKGMIDFITFNIRSMVANILDVTSKAAKLIGKEGLAKSLDELSAKLRAGIQGDTFINEISRQARVAQRELASLQRLAGKRDGTQATPKETIITSPITGLPIPTVKTKKPVTATAESGKFGALGFEGNLDKAKQEAEKYANLRESLENQVNAVVAQSLKKDRDSLENHVAGIEKQYEGLFKKLKELKADDAAVLTRNLRKAVDDLKTEAEISYWQKQSDSLDAVAKKFAEIDKQLGRDSGAEGRARIAAGIAEQFAQIRKDIDQIDLSKLGGAQKRLELLQKLAIDEATTTTRAVNKDLMREAEEAAAKVDALIDERNRRIKEAERNQATVYEETAQIIQETQPQIASMTDEVLRMLDALRGMDGIDASKLDALITKLKEGKASSADFKTEVYGVKDAVEDLSDIGVGTMDALGKNIADSAMGLQSWSDGIKNVGRAFAKMAAEMLLDIGKLIAKQQLLKLVQKGLDMFGVSVNHEGGVVGSTGRSRSVSASWFNSAPRYHGGGIAGLAPDEYPAILKKNEEVLTTGDPRNVLNGGMSPQQGGVPVVQDVKVMNLIDSGSFVSEGLSTAQGTKAVLNFITANRAQVKSLLG